jgi:hypothetical protein
MQKRIIVIFLLLFTIPILYFYHIKKYDRITIIKSFSEYDFSTITPQDLLVFDIDETLIQPTDSYLIHRNGMRGKLLLFLFGLCNNRFDIKEYHEIRFRQANRILIEPSIIATIQKLQQNEIPVIGCTAMKSGCIKTLQVDQWRYQDLKSLGFEGSWSNQIIMFDSLPGRQIFYKGCIFTDSYEKGPALEAFCKAISFKPKRIIFFDDCTTYLESVRTICDTQSIIFEGYLYQGLHTKPWNTQLAWYQLNYLVKYKRWLPDELALMELNGTTLSL